MKHNTSFILLLLLAIFCAVPAFAADLDSAKAAGLVGEQQNGYLAAVQPGSSAEIQALVSDVNQKRKEKYFEIAKKNGTELAAVEALAGKKAIEATPPGQFVQSANGQWTKK